jgi:hypothetical protein
MQENYTLVASSVVLVFDVAGWLIGSCSENVNGYR